MFYSPEQEKRIQAEQEIMRSGEAADRSLCQYRSVSCVRCCLPHIGGDSHTENYEDKGTAFFNSGHDAYHLRHSGRYLGPGKIVMKFNPLTDPKIEASQYEDSLPDVGKEEMERRFLERRRLFLKIYSPDQPRQSLSRYMKAAQKNEGYTYRHAASSGLASMYIGGSVPTKNLQKGELPECQLLGYVDGKRKVGCLAHPLAETSQGYDGRDLEGFFSHTGCCQSVGCEASKEFRFLSASAMKIFDRAIEGMTWYEYSRHATSVLVCYLRGYDYILQRLDERKLLDATSLEQLVEFINALYDKWPMRGPEGKKLQLPNPGDTSEPMNSLEILSTDIPLAERIMYIALDTWFFRELWVTQLQRAREHVEKKIEAAHF